MPRKKSSPITDEPDSFVSQYESCNSQPETQDSPASDTVNFLGGNLCKIRNSEIVRSDKFINFRIFHTVFYAFFKTIVFCIKIHVRITLTVKCS